MKILRSPFYSDVLHITFLDILKLLLGKKLEVSGLKVSMRKKDYRI